MESSQNLVQKMEIAARNIEKALMNDSSAPRLIDLMNINPQSGPTASGLSDHDYPTMGLNYCQIKCIGNVALPKEIVEHFNHVQCHCMMGLFSEIGRAWLTVDSDIYIWTYEGREDLAYFDGISETILSVALVKPKPGVFHSFIKHLLLLATTVDIVVLAVTFAEGSEELQLVSDPVFTIPTDGSVVSVITGSEDGRIFYGTKEGTLFEIVYQAKSGWFGKRCEKVNLSRSVLSILVPSFLNAALSEDDGIIQISIDDSRHILYALSEKGTIEVCDLGEKGQSFSRIAKMSQNTLVNQAMNTVKTLDSQTFRPIISISAVESYESANVNLVAVSQQGVRFYLTVVGLSNLQPNQRPYTLALMHVRLPPGFSANVTVKPRDVHVAHYRDRTLAFISAVNEKDTIWCMSSDLFPFGPGLMEVYNTVNLDGPALAISEVKFDSYLYYVENQEAPPLVVRQHVEPPKKYIVLTSNGIQIFKKLRPIDILQQILIESVGQNNNMIKSFFMMQQEDQACATALILASLENSNSDVVLYATRMFFQYGGEPKVAPSETPTLFSPTVFSPNLISTPAPQFQQQFAHMTSPTTPRQTKNYDGPFIFSPKHNALYLFLSRILGPIWNRRCINRVSVDDKTFIYESTIGSDDCIYILNNLTALYNFITNNSQLSMVNTSANVSLNLSVTRVNYTTEDAQMEERQSLEAFKVFLYHCCQVVGLWRILCEHQFHALVGAMPECQLQILQNITFKDLFLYQQNICSLLITMLINSYLADNASVDSINNKLREVCPQLYKNEDAKFSKATEMLKSVRSIQNKEDEKEQTIFKALQLCKEISPNINLTEICKEFTTLKAYKAVVDLCHCCGCKIDPDKVAENYYNSTKNDADREGYRFFQKRFEVYKQILNMLDEIYEEERQQNVNVEPQTNQSILPYDIEETKLGYIMLEVVKDILKTPDEIMHITLYDWMVSKNMTGDLIRISNPSLESFLKRTSVMSADNIKFMDLLWKYYEANGNHVAAAKVLNNLATRRGTTISLGDRLSYLARAILCMRNDKVGYAPHMGALLRDLEDRMEVGKVQNLILQTIISIQNRIPNAQEIIADLNSGLYEVSQLYENFADPYNLLECKLAIIDCAGYTDQNLVESIWQQILAEEVKKSTGSGNDRMAQILTKVKELARQYGLSLHCFPLNFIVLELEIINAKLRGDKHLVPTTLLSIDVPFEKLITVYNNLITISSNDIFWQTEENEFHLCEATAALITCFVETHERYHSVEKRKLISYCQDTVASLVSTLYSKPNTERLIDVLKGIQARLARI